MWPPRSTEFIERVVRIRFGLIPAGAKWRTPYGF